MPSRSKKVIPKLACSWRTYVRQIGRVHARKCREGDDGAMTAFQMAARMEGLFLIYKSLANMGGEGQRFVAACQDTPAGAGDFGSMRARGETAELIATNVRKLDRELARIPLRPSGDKEEENERLLEAAGSYLEVAVNIPGMGVAGATRILCSKRPDRFVCLNGDNKDGFREATQYPLRATLKVEDYIELMREIQKYPWYNEPHTSVKYAPAHEQALWAARAAFADHLTARRSQPYFDDAR